MQIPFSPPGRWQVAREGREGRGEGARNRGVKFKLQRKIWRNVCVISGVAYLPFGADGSQGDKAERSLWAVLFGTIGI